MKAINIEQKFTKFSKNWHPHQIVVVDDMQIILTKLKGEFVWHSHENEDELFQIIKGTLYMQFRDKTEVVNDVEIIVAPERVEHNSTTKNEEEVHVLLFEKLNTAHTRTIKHKRTQTEYPKI